MRGLLHALAWLYLTGTALVIYLLPYSGYEWMLEQIETGAYNPYCSLPAYDHSGMVLATLALLVPVVLGAPAYVLAHKRWDALLWGAFAVITYAVLKWALFNPLYRC